MQEYIFGNAGSLLKDVENNEYIPFMKDISLKEFSVVDGTEGTSEIVSIYADPHSDYLIFERDGRLARVNQKGIGTHKAGDYITTMKGIIADDTYFYANCTQSLVKINKETMAVVATYDHTGIYSESTIAMDSDNLYIGVGTTVKKVRKSDMTVVATSSGHSSSVLGICVLGTSVYTHWLAGKSVRKLNALDLTSVSFSASLPGVYVGEVSNVQTDGSHIYASVNTTATSSLYKIDKDTLAIVVQSPPTPTGSPDVRYCGAFFVDEEYIYLYSGDIGRFYKANKTDLRIVASGVTIANGVTYKRNSKFGQLLTVDPGKNVIYVVAQTGLTTNSYVVLKTVKDGSAIEGYRRL